MYPMMNTIGLPAVAFAKAGWGSGLILLWGLHIVSIIVFGIGVSLLLIWAFKYLSEHGLWKWGWVFIVLGTILCFLTISAWPSFAMMGQRQGSAQNTDSAAQQKEEADGKALYDKLQAKQMTCADVSDSDFELIGEYAMSQMAGAGHEQMNTMMQRMMGKDGEEQMHIVMGKRATGCLQGTIK